MPEIKKDSVVMFMRTKEIDAWIIQDLYNRIAIVTAVFKDEEFKYLVDFGDLSYLGRVWSTGLVNPESRFVRADEVFYIGEL